MKLLPSYNQEVESAYIIRIPHHSKSMELAQRCKDSCDKVGMPSKFWDAVDGTGDSLVATSKDPLLDIIKLTNHFLSKSEVACFLSHFTLWSHCAQLDRPIVVLEHDAVMVQPFRHHPVFNSIIYLGCVEQTKGWGTYLTPPHGSEGPGCHFLLRAHAYALDPPVARALLAHSIRYGISSSADTFIRADIFPICQVGVYAYDVASDPTIKNRHSENSLQRRNDNLSR